MSKLGQTFEKLGEEKRKSLITYVVAGDPRPDLTVEVLHTMVASGVDAIELGVPFSDPEAEGPVIQLAHERALVHKVSLLDTLELVRQFRTRDADTPIILMGYLNPIEHLGYQEFAESASEAGVDGVIIVNLPPEEAGVLGTALTDNGVDLVYLLAPTTTDQRAQIICRASHGFVYYVSLKGTTGASTLDIDDVSEKLTRFRAVSDLPIMIGFGIKDGTTAAAVAPMADGVVVGSAIVNLMDRHADDATLLHKQVGDLVSEIRQAIDGAR